MKKSAILVFLTLLVSGLFARNSKRLYSYDPIMERIDAAIFMESLLQLNEIDLIEFILSDTLRGCRPTIAIYAFITPENDSVIFKGVRLSSFENIPEKFQSTKWAAEFNDFSNPKVRIHNPDFKIPFIADDTSYQEDILPHNYNLKDFPSINKWLNEAKTIYLNRDTIYCIAIENPYMHRNEKQYASLTLTTAMIILYLKQDTDFRITDSMDKKISYLKEWISKTKRLKPRYWKEQID